VTVRKAFERVAVEACGETVAPPASCPLRVEARKPRLALRPSRIVFP
jgi:hypothetical protein